MRIPDSLVEKLLNATGKVTAEQLTTLRDQEIQEKKPLQDLVIKNNILTEKGQKATPNFMELAFSFIF